MTAWPEVNELHFQDRLSKPKGQSLAHLCVWRVWYCCGFLGRSTRVQPAYSAIQAFVAVSVSIAKL